MESSIIEAETGMGMSKSLILFKVRLPLATKPIFAGIHLAVVYKIGIATISASINTGKVWQNLVGWT